MEDTEEDSLMVPSVCTFRTFDLGILDLGLSLDGDESMLAFFCIKISSLALMSILLEVSLILFVWSVSKSYSFVIDSTNFVVGFVKWT